MRVIIRLAVLMLGLVGVLNGVLVDVIIFTYRLAADKLGVAHDQTHGILGIGLCFLAFLGAVVALRSPLIGGILLLASGLGFFFVVGWWALLVSPSWLVGGALSVAEHYDAAHDRLQKVGNRLAPKAGAPQLPPGAEAAS